MAQQYNGLDINLQGLFSEKITDISRAYLFRLTLPNFVQEEPYSIPESLITAWIRTTSLPKYEIQKIDIPLQGQNIRIAGPATFDGTWTVTFLLDETHSLRHQILKWSTLAYDGARMSHSSPGSYKNNTFYSQEGSLADGTVSITQVNKRGQPVAGYTFAGIYPSEVGEVTLSQDNGDPSTFQVTFTYDYFGLTVGAETSELTEGGSRDDQIKGIPFSIA
jgi:hypothetical protein